MPNRQIFDVIRNNLTAVMEYAGNTATQRVYMSASANSAEYGLGSAHSYSTRTITALFEPMRPNELIAAGGFYMQGDIKITTVLPIGKRDEFIYEGNRYVVISDPIGAYLFGTAASQTVLRRG
jgi:hypothetical protein